MKGVVAIAVLVLAVVVESRYHHRQHHPFSRDRSFDVEELEDFLTSVRSKHHARKDAMERRHFNDFEMEEYQDDDDDDEDDLNDKEYGQDQDFISMKSLKNTVKDHERGMKNPIEEGIETTMKPTTPEPTTSPTTAATTASTTIESTTPVPTHTEVIGVSTKTTKPVPSSKKHIESSAKLHRLLEHFSHSIRSLRYNEIVNQKIVRKLFKEIIVLKGKVRKLEKESTIEKMIASLMSHRGRHGHMGGMIDGSGREEEGGEESGGDYEKYFT